MRSSTTFRRKIVLSFLFITSPIFGQNLSEILEEYAEENAQETIALIENVVGQPIDLSKINADGVADLWFLSAEDRESLKVFLQRNKGTPSAEQLTTYLDLPEEIVRSIFKTSSPFKYDLYYFSRFKATASDGAQQHRIQSTVGNFALSLQTDQDPGEREITDFTGGHITYSNRDKTQLFTAGDFTIQAGLGLTFGGSFGSAPLAFFPNPKFTASARVRPFSSFSENISQRGIAFNQRFNRTHVILFGSQNHRDARFDEDNRITSFSTTGVHVTETELTGKDAAQENILGGIAEFLHAKGKMGFAVYNQHYESAVYKSDPSRKYFQFSGNVRRVLSLYSGMQFSETSSFGAEISQLNQDALAYALQFQQKFHRLKCIAAVWYAAANFDHPYGNLPNQRVGETSNERGYFLGMQYRKSGDEFSIALEHLNTPWRTYFIPHVTAKQSLTLRVAKKLNAHVRIQSKLRLKKSPKTGLFSSDLQYDMDAINYPLLISSYLKMRIKATRKVRLDYQLHYTELKDQLRPFTAGFAQIQSLNYHVYKQLKLRLRYAQYRIDDADVRIYSSEYRLPYLLVPAFFTDNGSSYLLTLQYKLAFLKLSAYIRGQEKQKEKITQWGVQINVSMK